MLFYLLVFLSATVSLFLSVRLYQKAQLSHGLQSAKILLKASESMAAAAPIIAELADLLPIPRTSATASMYPMTPGYFTTRYSFVYACDHNGRLYFGMMTESTMNAIANAKLRKCAAWVPLCGDGEFLQPHGDTKAKIEKLLGESSPTFPSILGEAGWSEEDATSLRNKWKSIYDKFLKQKENCYDIHKKVYDSVAPAIEKVHADVRRDKAKVADLEQRLEDFRIFAVFGKKREPRTANFSIDFNQNF